MIRIGHGYDVHQLVEGRKLILGGVDVPHSKGLEGHSDGDAVLHAICDAMLGALALGDIGQHFSPNDPQFKGADSRDFIRHINGLVAAEGYVLNNLDATIIAQAPKLASFVPKMRQTIADDLGVELFQVSVKATTTDYLGFTGREEGVAVHCVVLLVRE